jgi:antitoxin component of MazEF toxin-antitoxin module
MAYFEDGFQVEESDGVEVVKRNGEIIKDPTTLKPLDTKTAISNYIEERKIGKVIQQQTPQGRAGSDSKHPINGITSMKQFKEHIKTLNISENGAQAVSLLKEISSANPNFDFSVKE